MPSLPSTPTAPQGREPGRPTRSVGAVRHRATVASREQWSARWIMRGMRVAHSYGVARNVLVSLLLLADGALYVTATAKEIGEIAGMSKDMARWHLRKLRELGDISIAKRGGGRGRPNEYHLDLLDDGTDGDAA